MKIKKYPMYYAGKKAPFAKTAVVDNFVFCSGFSGQTIETFHVDSANVAEQTMVSLNKLRSALEEAGSSMDNIFKTVTYVKHMEDYPAILATQHKYYKKYAPRLLAEPPVDTLVQIPALHEPDMLVEVEATAVISRDKPGLKVKTYPIYYAGKKAPFSQSAVVGNFVFCSAFGGLSTETGSVASDAVEDQVVTILETIRDAVEEAGSSMNNIFKTVLYLKDPGLQPIVRKTEIAWYQKHFPRLVEAPPASVISTAVSLREPTMQVQYEAMAVIDRDAPDWKMIKCPMYYAGKKVYFAKYAVVGDIVFNSGFSGQTVETFHVDSDNVGDQTIVSLNKVRSALEQAGSSMDNIFKTVTYVKHMEDYPAILATQQEYYKKYAPRLLAEPPTDTLIQIVALHEPDMLVEIETTAVISR